MKLIALLLFVGLTGLAVQSNGSARSEGRTLREELQQPAENIRTPRATEALLPERDLPNDQAEVQDESLEGSDSSALTTPPEVATPTQ